MIILIKISGNEKGICHNTFPNFENVGKHENAGQQHFLLFPLCSPKFSRRAINTWICLVKS